MAAAGDIANYTLRIGVEGADNAAKQFDKVKSASASTSAAFKQHHGALERYAMQISKASTGSMMLLRNFGPLGVGAIELAERIERSALRMEKMGAAAASAKKQGDILEHAFKQGAISAASMEAVLERLTIAQKAAADAANVHAAAQTALAAAKTGSLESREMLAIQKGAVRTYTGDIRRTEASLKSERDVALQTELEKKLGLQRRELAGETAVLNRMEIEHAAVLTHERNKTLELAAASKGLSEAKAEEAAATRLSNEAHKATGIGLGGTVAIIAGLVAVLVTLAAGIYAVEKAWHFFKESIKVSAEEESQAFGFQQLIGDAELAHEKLEELQHFRGTAGIFKLGDITAASQHLLAMGTGIDNLTPRIEAFANLAAAKTGATITSIAQVYDRMRIAIESGMGIGSREVRTFATQGINIIDLLTKSSGKSGEEIQSMFKKRQINIEMINKAIEDATTGTGKYANMVEKRAHTMEGALAVLHTRWEQLHEAFGKPIVEAITPIFTNLAHTFETLQPQFKEMGERVAAIIEAFRKVAADQGWAVALKTTWTTLMHDMAEITKTTLKSAFVDSIPGLAEMKKGWQIMLDQRAQDLRDAQKVPGSEGVGETWAEGQKSRYKTFSAMAMPINFLLGTFQAGMQLGMEKIGDEAGKMFVNSLTGSTKEHAPEAESAVEELVSAIENLVTPLSNKRIEFAFDFEETHHKIAEAFAVIQEDIEKTFKPIGIGKHGEDAVKQYFDGAFKEFDAHAGQLELKLEDVFKPPTPQTLIGGANLFESLSVGGATQQIRGGTHPDRPIESPEKTGKEKKGPKYGEIKTDIDVINQFIAKQNELMSESGSITEKNRRLDELKLSTARQLYDPKQFKNYIDEWILMEEERVRESEMADRKIAAGHATLFQSMEQGLRKASEAIGKWQAGVADIITKTILNFGDGFATAFSEIIEGAKSAKDAFKDFALSLLKDVERMIIKLLIMQAIQAALGYFGYGINANTGTIAKLEAGGAVPKKELGGPITGPSHARGGVKIEAEGGEYIIRKSRVRNEKIELLDAYNQGKAMIVPKEMVSRRVEESISKRAESSLSKRAEENLSRRTESKRTESSKRDEFSKRAESSKRMEEFVSHRERTRRTEESAPKFPWGGIVSRQPGLYPSSQTTPGFTGRLNYNPAQVGGFKPPTTQPREYNPAPIGGLAGIRFRYIDQPGEIGGGEGFEPGQAAEARWLLEHGYFEREASTPEGPARRATEPPSASTGHAGRPAEPVAARATAQPFNLANFQQWNRRGAPFAPSAGTTAFERAHAGTGFSPREAQRQQSFASGMEMAHQAEIGFGSNEMGTTTDEGHTIFNPRGRFIGGINEEGILESRPSRGLMAGANPYRGESTAGGSIASMVAAQHALVTGGPPIMAQQAVERPLGRMHTGGILGLEGGTYAVGGEVPFIGKQKEGVFTPGQMAALAPASNTSTSTNSVVVHYHAAAGGGGGTASRSESGSTSSNMRELERLIVPVVEKWARKNDDMGGRFYRDKSGRRN